MTGKMRGAVYTIDLIEKGDRKMEFCYSLYPPRQKKYFSVETNGIVVTYDYDDYLLAISKEAPYNA